MSQISQFIDRPKLKRLDVGDRVRITEISHPRYGRVGRLESRAARAIWVELDGSGEYVRVERREIEECKRER